MAGTSAGAKKGWATRKRASGGRAASRSSKGSRERKAEYEKGSKARIRAIMRKQGR